jgi:hypothetical protein
MVFYLTAVLEKIVPNQKKINLRKCLFTLSGTGFLVLRIVSLIGSMIGGVVADRIGITRTPLQKTC